MSVPTEVPKKLHRSSKEMSRGSKEVALYPQAGSKALNSGDLSMASPVCPCPCEDPAAMKTLFVPLFPEGDIQCHCPFCGPEVEGGEGVRRCTVRMVAEYAVLAASVGQHPAYCNECQDCNRQRRIQEALKKRKRYRHDHRPDETNEKIKKATKRSECLSGISRIC